MIAAALAASCSQTSVADAIEVAAAFAFLAFFLWLLMVR
jgi:hypothetical protein